MLMFEVEIYHIPIKLIGSTTEKDDVKHSHYVCEKCKSDEIGKFCVKCNTLTNLVKFYSEGEKEDVGSRDMWDLTRISTGEINLNEIESWKWIEQAEIRKPKASDMAKYKEIKEKLGKSATLEDLFKDMLMTKTVFKGKIVLHSKVNEIYVMPFKNTLIAGITDGNNFTVSPKQTYKLEELKTEKPIEKKKEN